MTRVNEYSILSHAENSNGHLQVITDDYSQVISDLPKNYFDVVIIDLASEKNTTSFPYKGGEITSNTSPGHSIYKDYLVDVVTETYLKMNDDSVAYIVSDSNLLGVTLLVCDSIFGVENRIEIITWTNRKPTGSIISSSIDYIIVVAKNKKEINSKALLVNPFGLNGEFGYKDEKGRYRLKSISTTNEKEGYDYSLILNEERIYKKEDYWKYTLEEIKSNLGTKFQLMRDTSNNLIVLEKEYAQKRHYLPTNNFSFDEDTNKEYLASRYEALPKNRLSTDVYLAILRMYDKQNIRILDINNTDRLLHFVVDWENTASLTKHTVTSLVSTEENMLGSAIQEDTSITTLLATTKKLDVNDVAILINSSTIYQQLVANIILMTNGKNVIQVPTIEKMYTLAKQNTLSSNIYFLENSDIATLSALQKEFPTLTIYSLATFLV